MDRSRELEAFKTLNLSVVASAYGYEIDRMKSTRHSVLMSSGNDKIIITQSGQHYVYCSVFDPNSNGTVIDFAQKVIEPGCSLGRVRQLLRPFLSGSYMEDVRRSNVGRFAEQIRPSEPDLTAVAARYARFAPITEPHHFLCTIRGIPFNLLQSPRLRDRILHCPKGGAVIFPHWGDATPDKGDEHCLVGYEIKGPGINLYSKGGRKGLWISGGETGDRKLAIAESGLDAISYLALRGETGLRVASISGRMNPQQPALVRSAIERMGEAAQVIAAFDNDRAGDELTQQLAELVGSIDRSDLEFKDDRPVLRGHDWNHIVMDQSASRHIVRR